MPGKQKMTGHIGASKRRCNVWTWWRHYERKRGVSCMNIQPDFEELLRLLEKHDVDYMIVGGYAVAFHGHPRFTKDIDIFFSADKDNVERIKEALHDLEKMGYTLALVADTRPGTYKNVLTMHGLYDLFSVFSISEELGTEKPDPRMFQYVLDKLGVLPEETVMCGNNLKKDIAGANKMGMTTVWFHWNDRYDTTPRTELEHPDYTVRSAKDLIDLVKRLT